MYRRTGKRFFEYYILSVKKNISGTVIDVNIYFNFLVTYEKCFILFCTIDAHTLLIKLYVNTFHWKTRLVRTVFSTHNFFTSK